MTIPPARFTMRLYLTALLWPPIMAVLWRILARGWTNLSTAMLGVGPSEAVRKLEPKFFYGLMIVGWVGSLAMLIYGRFFS